MFKNFILISCLFLMSCIDSEPKHTFKLLYEFENNAQLSEADRLETVQVLKARFEKFSSDYEVSLTNDKKIKILTKTSFDENRVNALITNQGKLEFWELYKSEDLYPFILDVDKLIKGDNQDANDVSKSITDVISSTGSPDSPILFYVKPIDTSFINATFKNQTIKNLLASNLKYTKFLWGLEDETYGLPLYAIKSNRDGKANVTGEHVTFARQDYSVVGIPTVSIQMDGVGSNRWERMTEKAFREQTCIAATLNDIVFSAPGVTSGPIHGGRSEISGNFTLQEAQDLATVLSSSKSIPKLKLLQSSIIKD